MTRSNLPPSADVQAARRREWDTYVPKLARQALEQLTEPLPSLASDLHRAEVLRLLREETSEQLRRLPHFARYDALDPLTVRDSAVCLESDAEYNAFLLLEIKRELLHYMRVLQLEILGYSERPGVQESTEASLHRAQRQAQRRKLFAPAKPARKGAPSFDELFRRDVNVPGLIATLKLHGVIDSDEQWVGLSGKKIELISLLVALNEGN
ncbi:hypothetical protein F0P96_18615 [Hymenobacter busanensis]|uniref:Uncharacterized protein n=1 Tax=Hymenobacter busanensis TaxID=2607656 RepID=A0A7L4ZUQ0_9BACT|nr:hypothetical protein [Hymenobacter busanensis]KAA9327246.1 hypothetical protein F0P96_18615 [Hymenobacter busanensis]QHJ05912.1 hypothetical protein GUY19_00820 [Hymenobacter busanensis]